MLLAFFQDLIKYKDLVFMLTLRDVRIRYKQAVMGFCWALFMPIIAIVAGLFVKMAMTSVLNQQLLTKDVLNIALRVLPWTFFVSALRFSLQSLVGHANLISKIYFPRSILPLAAILACALDFFIAWLVFLFLIFIVFAFPCHVGWLWVPIIFLFIFVFILGCGLWVAAANLFFRDIKYVVEILLMFGVFFTPVFYSANLLGEIGVWMMINPLSGYLESLSGIILRQEHYPSMWLMYSILASLSVFLSGILFFKRLEPVMAEYI